MITLKKGKLAFLLMLTTALITLAQPTPSFDGIKKINGTELYCKVIGSGEPILIVHGGPGLAHDYLFEPFKLLADNYKLVFNDQRGCGRSSSFTKDEKVDMETLVEDLEGIRKEFNLEKVYLAGQSWGATIALNYTLKYPQHVKKLLLLEPAPGSSEFLPEIQKTILSRLSGQEKENLTKLSQMPEVKTNPETFIQFMEIRTNPYFFDSSFAKKRDFGYFNSDRVQKFFASSAMFAPYMMNYNLYPRLKEISCPILIVHGDYDIIPTEAVEKMDKEIKDCEMNVVSDCGHFVHIEKPEIYFGLIRKFLTK